MGKRDLPVQGLHAHNALPVQVLYLASKPLFLLVGVKGKRLFEVDPWLVAHIV